MYSPAIPELTPKPRVAERLGVSSRAILNWMSDPKLNFPEPIRINARVYFRTTDIDQWVVNRARASTRGGAK